MKTTTAIPILSALVASAWAQNNGPTVPAGTSPACTDFLSKLNADTGVGNCLTKIIDSTSAFAPTGNGGPNINGTTVSNVLNNICATSFQSCSPTTIRPWIANFYSSCSKELLEGVKDIVAMYDVLYLVVPLKEAICSRDDAGKYCVQQITVTPPASTPAASSAPASSPASSSASSAASSPAASPPAAKRDTGSLHHGPVVSAETIELLKSTTPYQVVSDEDNGFALGIPPKEKRQENNNNNQNQSPFQNLPNADLYYSTSLPYLFIAPTYTSEELCKPCTKHIIGQYIAFESVTPYALGIGNSPILKGQLELWKQITQCPEGFAASILDTAIPDRPATGAATISRSSSAAIGFGVLVGAVAMMM